MNYKEYICALEELFYEYEKDGILVMPNITEVFIGIFWGVMEFNDEEKNNGSQ